MSGQNGAQGDGAASPRLDDQAGRGRPGSLKLTFFNPWNEVRHTSNYLPHWQQPGATYFVTFRMADSIPAHLRNELKAERAIWLNLHPEPWTAEVEAEYHERFSGAVERWLDAGHGSCALRDPGLAQVLGGAFAFSMPRVTCIMPGW